MPNKDAAQRSHAKDFFLSANFAIGITVVLLACLLWRPLWLDEFGTDFAAHHPWSLIAQLTGRHPSGAPLYPLFMAYCWLPLFGNSEIALRVPSFCFLLVAAWNIFRLTKREVNTEAGLIATAVFLPSLGVFWGGAMARPIALALAFEAIALNFWLRWMSNPTKINSRVSLIALILAFYTHHTHGTILLVLYTLVFISWLKRDTRSLPAFRTLLLPATICILPVALSIILHVAQSPDSLVFLKAPTLSALLAEIVPLPIACVLLVTLFLRIIGKIELMRPSLNSSTYTIMVATSCLVVPPVALYLASSLFHTSAFAPRALGLSKIGASILAGYGLSSITTKRARGSLTMAVALISLSTSLIRLEAPCRFPYLYQQITNPDETALFYGSGFLESVRPDFLYSGEYQGHFISPLTYYPPPASVGFLPTHAFYESTSRYVSALIRLHMGAKNKAALIRHDFSEPISQTFNTEMTRLGFHKIASTSGGSIFLEQYERASEDTPETLPPVSTELPLIVVRGDDD